jgi:hypothetical protein
MTSNIAKNFPGVYTQIIDNSFYTASTSRFKPGLIGVATKGPLNTPTTVISLTDFINKFGSPLKTEYKTDSTTGITTPTTDGYFLADAVDACCAVTNAITVVRIGKSSTTFSDADAQGAKGTLIINTANNYSRVNSLQQNGSVYVTLVQDGQDSTVNALATTAANGTISIDGSEGMTLADDYTNATVSYSIGNPAVFAAEGVLKAYTYGADSSSTTDLSLDTGATCGTKGSYSFTVTKTAASIAVGGLYKIAQVNKATTAEIRIARVAVNSDSDGSGTVYIETSDISQVGYQAVALQDTYTAGLLYKATGAQPFLYLKAASEGTWANGGSSSEGLYVKVRPGSSAGTKKLEVYWNSGLVETHDNLSAIPTSSDYYMTRLGKGNSDYVYAAYCASALSAAPILANTCAPWDSTYYVKTTSGVTPVSMPVGAVNAGNLYRNQVLLATGGQFSKGCDGENVDDTDWIGTLNPATEKLTGIRAFENTRKVTVNVIAAPKDNMSIAIMQQLASTCNKINAYSVIDVPSQYNGKAAIDWHNGVIGTNSGRLDSHNVGCFWNWLQRSNSFGETKFVPPTVFWLGKAGDVFNKYGPYYAIAGEVRGYLDDAEAVQFDEISDDTLEGMYGNGNSVNPVLDINGKICIYGERTMQRADSKLTAAHSVICVNWCVTETSSAARRFVFDPNDSELLDGLKLAFVSVLDAVKADRGLESYSLDFSATASDRNNRQVICNMGLTPTDVAERIYINATVNSSGVTVNSVS